MNQKLTLIAGAILGALGVGIGAFGAHTLKNLLVQNGRTETFELAVRYQFYHALALLAIGLLMEKFPHPVMQWASASLLGGVILFSGSLYILALSNKTSVAIVTPFGGLFLLAGWILLIVALLTK